MRQPLSVHAWGVVTGASFLLWWSTAVFAREQAKPSTNTATPPVSSSTNPEPAPITPSLITLEPGEIRSVPVSHEVTRIVVSDPNIVDVNVLATNELLLQAKNIGTTQILLWDQQGQHTSQVEVVNTKLESQLTQVLKQIDMPSLQLKRENDKYFLVGQVPKQEDINRLQQVLAAFGTKITNLVTAAPPPPPPAPEPVKSVTLVVQLIEMNRNATDRFGVNWVNSLNGLTVTEAPFKQPGPSGGILEGLASLGESFRLGTFSRTGLQGVLSMLVSQGKARILAEPKLVAGSGKKATARLGVEVPIVLTNVSNGVVSQSVEFKNAGVDMSFEPTILPDDNKIQLVIDVRVTSLDATVAVNNIPGFRVRQAQSEIFTERGQTVVIAGLLQDEEKKSLSQVPGIGSIPGFGNLFRAKELTTQETELVVLITPEFLGDEAETAERNFQLEQSLARAEIAGSVQDPTLRYVLQIQDRVAKSLRYPQREKELGIDGRVKLKLHVFRDGTLGQAMIVESSGIESLDMEALKAAESQAPYPPFPSEFIQQDLWVELPVLFRP